MYEAGYDMTVLNVEIVVGSVHVAGDDTGELTTILLMVTSVHYI